MLLIFTFKYISIFLYFFFKNAFTKNKIEILLALVYDCITLTNKQIKCQNLYSYLSLY